MLSTAISEETCKIFLTFTDWTNEGDEAKIVPILAKFVAYCQPQKSTIQKISVHPKGQESIIT